MADEGQVTIQSQDGMDFQVEVRVAKMSETIRNLIEDAGVSSTIPLPNVSGKSKLPFSFFFLFFWLTLSHQS